MTENEPGTSEVVVGMATGSDAGAPGEHLPDPPLDEGERQLLSSLQEPTSAEPLVAVEDSPQMVSAAEDDGPLPMVDGDAVGPSGPSEGTDPDTAVFESPAE